MWKVFCKVCKKETGLKVKKKEILKELEYYCQCGYSGFADLGIVKEE